ncbi:MAG: hypothetical protein PVF68_04700 [Acidobacteriota bacterium]
MPRIVPVDYFAFRAALKRAGDAGQRIDPTQKHEWDAYVRKHNIPEAGMRKRAEKETMGDDFQSVIIHGEDAWEGLYIYAPDEQFCLRFDPAP